MPIAISNTSPLVYLHRIDALELLPQIFSLIWTPPQVVQELDEGRLRGYDVLNPRAYRWLEIVAPEHMPADWFALDLGAGEVAAMSLALENPGRVVILDDLLARRTAQAAGLQVWGTLRVLLAAKEAGLIPEIGSAVDRLRATGMYISGEVHRRILKLAGE